MRFFKKITQFFRGLVSKKPDEVTKKKDSLKSKESEVSSDSKFKSIVIKTSGFIYKYLKKFLIFILGLIHTMMQPMIKISKKHPIAFWVAVTFHVILLIGLLYANVDEWGDSQKNSVVSNSAPIKTVMLNYEIIEAEQDRLQEVVQQKHSNLVDI